MQLRRLFCGEVGQVDIAQRSFRKATGVAGDAYGRSDALAETAVKTRILVLEDNLCSTGLFWESVVNNVKEEP